jgi:hypothetical protein
MTKPYTKENLDKTIDSIKEVLLKQVELKSKYNELLATMIRHRRAFDPICWVDMPEFKKLKIKEILLLMREEKCVNYPSSGSQYQDAKEFPFFAKKQWQKDREELIKSGKIVV